MRDAYDLHVENEERLEKMLARLPKCCLCGEHIQQEDAVRIGHAYYCDDCLKDSREEIGG
jgi:formylmethanofuran dehydrogenase subunit E